MKEEDLKTQWMNLHIALSDWNSHDIKRPPFLQT